jgi:glycosyltransferase involved in cell wall biosynthesis
VEEMIADERNGYLVTAYDCQEMAQKLIHLIEDEKLRREFSEQATLHLDNFCMDKIIEKWNEVFEQLCG